MAEPVESPFGPPLIGSFVAHILFGALCVQTHSYFFSHSNGTEPWANKILVASVWIMELGHSVLMSHSVYDTLITRTGDKVWHPTATVEATILLQAFVASVVQLFYAHRLRRFSNQVAYFYVMLVLILTRLGFSAALTVGLVRSPSFGSFIKRIPWVTITPISMGIGIDVIITIGMNYYLQRSKTRFKHTREMINYLMLLSIESSGLTTIVGLLFLILLMTQTANMTWQAFYFVWGKIYSNSLLITLNSRSAIRERTMGKGTHTIPLSELSGTTGSFAAGGPRDNSFNDSPRALEKGIHVTTSQITRADSAY